MRDGQKGDEMNGVVWWSSSTQRAYGVVGVAGGAPRVKDRAGVFVKMEYEGRSLSRRAGRGRRN